MSDLTASEKHGRELFGLRCANCHTLKAANAIAQVGPNLDQIAPEQGDSCSTRSRTAASAGNGQMAGGLYTGEDAEDVANFVAKAVGATEAPAEGESGGSRASGESSGG